MEWNENLSKQKIDQESKRKGLQKYLKKNFKIFVLNEKVKPQGKTFL